MANDEQLSRFYAQLAEDPDNEPLRAVFGDWLIEQGKPEHSEWMRLEQAHRRDELDRTARKHFIDLDKRIPADFRARMVRLHVEPCEADLRETFEYACPERWEAMDLTDDPRRRNCTVCSKPVHFVDSVEDARPFAWRGECVAITPSVERQHGDLNRPMVPGRRAIEPRPGPPHPIQPPPPVPGMMPAQPAPPIPEPPVVETQAKKKPWWRRLFGG